MAVICDDVSCLLWPWVRGELRVVLSILSRRDESRQPRTRKETFIPALDLLANALEPAPRCHLRRSAADLAQRRSASGHGAGAAGRLPLVSGRARQSRSPSGARDCLARAVNGECWGAAATSPSQIMTVRASQGARRTARVPQRLPRLPVLAIPVLALGST